MEQTNLKIRGQGNDSASIKNIALLTVRKVIAYIVLVLLSIMCLFTIYILIVNSTRSSAEIQAGFNILPGGNFIENWKSMASTSLPVGRGFLNSFMISLIAATLCCYFSAYLSWNHHYN